MNRTIVAVLTGASLVALGSGACATKSYVRQQVAQSSQAADAKIGEVQKQVETSQMDITQLKTSQADTGQKLSQLSDTAREALARAQEAGKLAQGKFLYEVVLSDNSVHFPFNSAALSKEAQQALDAFAEKLKQENKNVYIEIQGFTDSTGDDEYDVQLGQARATAVERYLSMHGGVPLHRMNVISYGKEKPIADNSTRDGRAKNRRVGLVVLT